ncbi:MAG: hypothetical protein AAF432_00105 [Planctomycetota bacterium]
MRRQYDRTGFSRVELLVLLVATAVVLSLGTTMATMTDQKTLTLKDATHLKTIHQSIMVFANDQTENHYPRPGLVNRKPVDLGGQLQHIPGRGEEDTTVNTTANFYSCMVTLNYFEPGMLISPVDSNTRVVAHAAYDYEAYNPVEDSYWDDTFKADLYKGSHTSYAHTPMYGKRSNREWRMTLNGSFVVVGNRGPKDGEPIGSSYTTSPHGLWSGNLAFNDNRTEYVESMEPEQINGRTPYKDNLFRADRGVDGEDVLIAFTQYMTKDGPKLQFD